MSALSWLKQNWWVPFLFLFLILSWVFFRRRGTPIEQTKRELEIIEAGRRARKLKEEMGLERAKAYLDVIYAQELAALDTKQQDRAQELRDNPQALARFLVRAGQSN